jgi:predicted O-methyltransferase YrrM
MWTGLKTVFHKLIERYRLAALPRATCDTSMLGSFSPAWLGETFTAEQIAADWTEDARRLDALDMPEMTGGVNPGDRRALYSLVRRTRPRSILEIGTHIGSSTVALALAAARNRAEGIDTGIITADIIDVNDPARRPWEDHRSPASPRSLVEAVGCCELVRFEVNPSINTLKRPDRRFGLIFLDGNHHADMVYREIPLALRRLEAPGLIVLHDYFPSLRPLWPGSPPIPGPFLAVDRFVSEGAGLHAVSLGDLPWPTKLSAHTTSLAILSRS